LTYLFLTYNVFTVDTSRYALNLAFEPLTLNVCSVSVVTWSNYVPNFGKIKQSAASLLRIQ